MLHFGTLYHHGDELLEILIKRGKFFFLRNNGGVNSEGGTTEQLSYRVREDTVGRLIEPLIAEVAGKLRAAAAAGAGGGGAALPAAGGAAGGGHASTFYLKHSEHGIDALPAPARFLDAWKKEGLWDFDIMKAVSYASVTLRLPPSHKGEEFTQLLHSPGLNKLGRDVVLLSKAVGSPPIEPWFSEDWIASGLFQIRDPAHSFCRFSSLK